MSTAPLCTVSRLHCESESFKMDLILDVNIQIYPVDLGTPPGSGGRGAGEEGGLAWPGLLLEECAWYRAVLRRRGAWCWHCWG